MTRFFLPDIAFIMAAACTPFPQTRTEEDAAALLAVNVLRQQAQRFAAQAQRGYRYIFPATGTYNGSFGGISIADGICNADVNRPSVQPYKALLAQVNGGQQRRACNPAGPADCAGLGGSQSFDWVLVAGVQYRQPDLNETIIGTVNSDLIIPLPMQAGFDSIGFYWSGLENDWRASATDCNGWSGAGNGMRGRLDNPNSQALSAGSPNCGATSASILCVEQ